MKKTEPFSCDNYRENDELVPLSTCLFSYKTNFVYFLVASRVMREIGVKQRR